MVPSVPLSELARRLAISAGNGVDPSGMIAGALFDRVITRSQARILCAIFEIPNVR